MPNWGKIKAYLIKQIPEQDKLKETLIYRIIGERLFSAELWKPSRKSIAGGMGLGVFIALTPTVGAQMFMSALAAYFLRVNIPLCVACAWITNPVTIPIIYPLQYKLGVLVFGHPKTDEFLHYSGKLATIIKYAKPLWAGSIISGAFFGLLSYILVIALWDLIERSILKSNVNSSKAAEMDHDQ